MPLYPQTLAALLAQVPGGRPPVIPLSAMRSNGNVPGVPATTFATWDPATKNAGITLSGGNLAASAGGVLGGAITTIGKSTGKWYWEITITADSSGSSFLGITDSGFNNATYPGNYPHSFSWSFGSAGATMNGVSAGSGGQGTMNFHVGDVVGLAFDAGSGLVWHHKNGVWSPNDPTGAEALHFNSPVPPYYPVTDPYTATHTANFGASAFSYTVPTGFNAGLF